MYCPQCGNEVADGSIACAICGMQFATAPISEQVDVQVQPASNTDQAILNQNDSGNVGTQPYVAPMQEQDASAMPPQEQAVYQTPMQGQNASVAAAQDANGNVNITSARNGLGNLFISQVIVLASTLGTLAIAVLTLVVAASSRTASAANAAVGLISGVAILAALLMIIAFVIRIVALYQVSKVNERFQMAFYLTIAAIVLAVLRQFVGGSSAADAIMVLTLAVVSYGLSLAIVFMLFKGIIDLANQLGDQGVASSGKTLLTASIVFYVLGIMLTVLAAVLSMGMTVILSIAAAIALLIPDILMLVMLSKGKKMLGAF